MVTDKNSSNRPTFWGGRKNEVELSDDITRIVEHLNNKRTNSNERVDDLAQEITQAREEGPPPGECKVDLERVNQPTAPEQNSSEDTAGASNQKTKLAISERHRLFCRELNSLANSFRTRMNEDKSVRH